MENYKIIENGNDIKKGDIISYGGTEYAEDSGFYGQPVLYKVKKIIKRKVINKKYSLSKTTDIIQHESSSEIYEYNFHCVDINTNEETKIKCKFLPSQKLPFKYLL